VAYLLNQMFRPFVQVKPPFFQNHYDITIQQEYQLIDWINIFLQHMHVHQNQMEHKNELESSMHYLQANVLHQNLLHFSMQLNNVMQWYSLRIVFVFEYENYAIENLLMSNE
jgi:hypothetical protein